MLLTTKALEQQPGDIIKNRDSVFAAAEVSAAKYKQQQQQLQQLQQAAAQQLLRSLGINDDQQQQQEEDKQQQQQTPEGAAAAAATAAAEETDIKCNRASRRHRLWEGVSQDNHLLSFLQQRLQALKRSRNSAAAAAAAAGTAEDAAAAAERAATGKVKETVSPLPGGGAVREVHIQEGSEEDAAAAAAAAAEAIAIRNALQQSKFILNSNWDIPKVTEGPLEHIQWEFI